jgi:hypothetical protein
MSKVTSVLVLALAAAPAVLAQAPEDKKPASEIVWEATIRGVSG